MKPLMMIIAAATTLVMAGCGDSSEVKELRKCMKECAEISRSKNRPIAYTDEKIEKMVEEFKNMSKESREQALKTVKTSLQYEQAAPAYN